MVTKRQIFGKKGEDIAVKFLKRMGYKIIETNYNTKFGEIDIIAKIKGTLSFIEVKTRKNENFGLAKEAVNFKKQEKIRRTGMVYIKNKNISDDIGISFDIIAIQYENGKPNIELIENAF